MEEIHQMPHAAAEMIETAYTECTEKQLQPTWKLHFLYSPLKIQSNPAHQVTGLQVEKNTLEIRNGEVKAKGSGQLLEIPADTVIFAIGDKVSNDLGLPMQGNDYAMNPAPQFPVEGISYEIFDAVHPEDAKGVFVAGWSRNPSHGLVGLARKDGTYAARAILAFLDSVAPQSPVDPQKLAGLLDEKGYQPVTLSALKALAAAEKEQAAIRGLAEFKFDTNEEMLQAIKLV
jgi:ferredoxin--NADP+ reductase